MKTIWLVVWVYSTCYMGGTVICKPSGYEEGCYCQMKHREFSDPLEAGKFAGERAPLSYVVAISTPAPVILDSRFEKLAEESAKQTDAKFCAEATEEWQRTAFCYEPKQKAEQRHK